MFVGSRSNQVERMIARRGVSLSREKEREGRLDGLLCSCNARSQKTLARANSTSRRVSGWAGEKVARIEGPSSLPSKETQENGGERTVKLCSFDGRT
jgi:hypothetical protein